MQVQEDNRRFALEIHQFALRAQQEHHRRHGGGWHRRRHMGARLQSSDYYFLGMMLVCACVVLSHWHDYASCRDPLNAWLVIDYLMLFSFRLLHFAAQRLHASAVPRPSLERAVVCFTVLGAYPFMWVWTVLGTIWLARSNQGECLPERSNFWGVIIWVSINYLLLVIYAFFATKALRHLRRGEGGAAVWGARAGGGDGGAGDGDAGDGVGAGALDHAALAARIQELAQRFGLVMQGGATPRGLTARQLGELPARTLAADGMPDAHLITCAICMDDLEVGDAVLELPCCHLFHRECLAEWLAQKNECPSCRRPVRAPTEAGAPGGDGRARPPIRAVRPTPPPRPQDASVVRREAGEGTGAGARVGGTGVLAEPLASGGGGDGEADGEAQVAVRAGVEEVV